MLSGFGEKSTCGEGGQTSFQMCIAKQRMAAFIITTRDEHKLANEPKVIPNFYLFEVCELEFMS